MRKRRPTTDRPVSRIIAKFGGIRPMAKLSGWPASTIQSWDAAGHIPSRRYQGILELAKREGIALKPADFFSEAS